jgi:hypothetical protein
LQFYAAARKTRRNALAHRFLGCNRFSESSAAKGKIFSIGALHGLKPLPQALDYGSFSAGRTRSQNSFF